jgi:hypothetical protein
VAPGCREAREGARRLGRAGRRWAARRLLRRRGRPDLDAIDVHVDARLGPHRQIGDSSGNGSHDGSRLHVRAHGDGRRLRLSRGCGSRLGRSGPKWRTLAGGLRHGPRGACSGCSRARRVLDERGRPRDSNVAWSCSNAVSGRPDRLLHRLRPRCGLARRRCGGRRGKHNRRDRRGVAALTRRRPAVATAFARSLACAFGKRRRKERLAARRDRRSGRLSDGARSESPHEPAHPSAPSGCAGSSARSSR